MFHRIKHSALVATMGLMTLAGAAQAQYYHHNDYYNGAYRGGRGDYYYGHRHSYDDRYEHHSGGIGPGKGALIGGAGGAALGALFGGGAKGALIGGAAGAGIGAIAGKEHQNHEREKYGYYR